MVLPYGYGSKVLLSIRAIIIVSPASTLWKHHSMTPCAETIRGSDDRGLATLTPPPPSDAAFVNGPGGAAGIKNVGLPAHPRFVSRIDDIPRPFIG